MSLHGLSKSIEMSRSCDVQGEGYEWRNQHSENAGKIEVTHFCGPNEAGNDTGPIIDHATAQCRTVLRTQA